MLTGVEETDVEDPQGPRAVLDPLVQRLRVAASTLAIAVPEPLENPGQEAAAVLAALLEGVHGDADGDGDPDPRAVWLVLTALGSAFPSTDELLQSLRLLRAVGPVAAFSLFLRGGYHRALNNGAPRLEMDVVRGEVVVDVDFCATSDLHTGIQRVVRETLPRWERDHELRMLGWTENHGAFRGLDDSEVHRVLRWGSDSSSGAGQPPGGEARRTPAPQRLVVPWGCTVVLPETAEPQRCALLAALARFSGNAVVMVGYDCIPLVSPELIHPGLPERFTRYLSLVKHARTVAGISISATTEFEGFRRMVGAQGLPGPRVVECVLPVEVPPVQGPRPTTDIPMVMSVGSFEPRKNQLAVLHAAERLWREGLRFEVRFVGGGGYLTEFDTFRARLVAAGRPITMRTAITDAQLWHTYRSARFTVFASLHEGFGLPVAESLALGTPALTTSYGSTLEIAEGGGALTVDPRDDDALAEAMRRLLTDDALVEELRRAAAARPPRTWDDYSRELWQHLVVGSSASPETPQTTTRQEHTG